MAVKQVVRKGSIHLSFNPVLQCIPDIVDRFWEQVIVDALINNNDRNNGNWGVLYENGEQEFINCIPENYDGVPICSKTRKQFCIQSIYYRFENFLLPVYDKAVEKGFVFQKSDNFTDRLQINIVKL